MRQRRGTRNEELLGLALALELDDARLELGNGRNVRHGDLKGIDEAYVWRGLRERGRKKDSKEEQRSSRRCVRTTGLIVRDITERKILVEFALQ